MRRASHLPQQHFSVLTGAGVSVDPPATLPAGDTLRDAIINECFAAAARLPGADLPADPKEAIIDAGWKLEYVVGRLEGTVGPRAWDCLKTLVLATPNENHMLLALHLLRGGRQVTLNFDQGIEMAYGLITGAKELPTGAPATFREHLPAWRAVAPDPPPDLIVVATEDEFARWRPGLEPVLFKIHGSIAQHDDGEVLIVEPWVIDDVEFAQLSAHRLRALDAIAQTGRVLVTGYSGEDLDCYEPLLERLDAGTFQWVLPHPQEHPQLAKRLHALTESGASPGDRKSQPEKGRAVEALGQELPDAPAWPNEDDGLLEPFARRFARWRRNLSDEELAEALAWMFMDATRYDDAVALYETVARRMGRTFRLRMRLADALYHRDREMDKRRARAELLRLAFHRSAAMGDRSYALIRWGETHRPEIAAGGFRRLWALAAAAAGPAVGLALAIAISDGIQQGRALSALGHLGLRLLEGVMAEGPPHASFRPVLRAIGAASMSALRRGIPLASGNRQAFMRQQKAEVASLMTLLGGAPPANADRELDELQRLYERGTDPRGVSNVQGAKALVALVTGPGGADRALEWLQAAEDSYRVLESESGLGLVKRRRRLVRNFRAAGALTWPRGDVHERAGIGPYPWR